MTLLSQATLLGFVSLASAYGPPGYSGPGAGYGPYRGGGEGGNDFSNGPFGSFDLEKFLGSSGNIIIAHAVLAALAFVVFFPLGSILIRLGSFRGLWIVHGLFQIFAYMVYIAAFGLGVWMVQNFPTDLMNRYHPIIGVVVLVLLFFQPFLGFVHHVQYKKYSRRTIWSYGHLWLGRGVITLGIINGGLGLLLATEGPFFRPTRGHIIAYGVVAGIMWLLWVLSAIAGERRRRNPRRTAKINVRHNKEEYA